MTHPHKIEHADPLIDDVRRIRAKLEEQFGDDWNAYAEHIRKVTAKIRAESVGRDDPLKIKIDGQP